MSGWCCARSAASARRCTKPMASGNDGSTNRRVSCLPSYSQPSSSGSRRRISSSLKGMGSTSLGVTVGLGMVVRPAIRRRATDRTALAAGGHQRIDREAESLELLARHAAAEGGRRALLGLDLVRQDDEQLLLLVVAEGQPADGELD